MKLFLVIPFLFCHFLSPCWNYNSPLFCAVFLSTRVWCSNYFKVIRALIAGRCFSGGQVPGGESAVTHSTPALCVAPSLLPQPSFAAVTSLSATLQHNRITAGEVTVLQNSLYDRLFLALLAQEYPRYALSKVRKCLRHNLCSQPYGSKSLVRSTGSAVWNF
jgi:hypothetical protein